MEKYIGIGFIFLCLSILVGIIGIVKYEIFISKEKVDIRNQSDINNSKTTND